MSHHQGSFSMGQTGTRQHCRLFNKSGHRQVNIHRAYFYWRQNSTQLHHRSDWRFSSCCKSEVGQCSQLQDRCNLRKIATNGTRCRDPHTCLSCVIRTLKNPPSKLLRVYTVQPSVRQRPALVGVEIRDILQNKHRHTFAALGFDMLKVNSDHIVQPEWWSDIFLQITDFHVSHCQSFYVPDEESVSR